MGILGKEDTAKTQDLERQLQYNEKLKYVTNKIHSANNLNEILIKIKDEILSLFDADRITIYSLDTVKNELYSRYMVGNEVKEIRVPVSSTSIAGFTAKFLRLVNISDVYNSTDLSAIDTDLHFDSSWDQKTGYKTKQILAAPILFENRLLGVIQFINKKNAPAFTNLDEKNVSEIARILGIAFRNQSRMLHTKFDYLISQNIINENDLKEAMAKAREKSRDIEAILMEDYKVKKSDIGTSLSQFYGCRFVEFSNTMIIPRELIKGLSPAYLKKSFWVPIATTEDTVTVLIDNPRDPKTMEIKSLFGSKKKVEFDVGLKADIIKFLEYDTQEGVAGNISDILAEMEVKEEKPDPEVTEAGIDENASTIVRLVNQIIIDGYEKGASDIHVEPSKAKKITNVRFRVDGACIRHLEIPLSYSRAITSRIKIMSNLDIAERRLPQDGKIKFSYKDKNIELRVATLPTVGGEDVVMRILASSEAIPFNQLNLSERNYREFKKIVSQPYGIILVVGPTGSGKTTTLHSAVALINTPERKIWTAEDPVEITQEGLRQVEVKPKIDFNFARAMRAFLRADPDVIMVGEMRDYETASIGIEASLTGHLVFSTLHTNSAPETITRLIDMGIDPFNFADALLGVLAQRLIRTLCKKCKESYHPAEEEFLTMVNDYGKEFFAELGIEYNDNLVLYRPKGCNECNQTGYKGRTGIHELLVGTKTIKPIIAKKAPVDEIREHAIKEGMRTLYQDGITKVFKGFTDLKQVRSVCLT
ncbi:MAG: GspE/PulE family protein [Nitrospirota bacterium]